jgi:hypothetical protein
VSGRRESADETNLAEIAARLEAAVEEWDANGIVTFRLVGLDGLPVVAPAVMTFLANAPADVSALLAEVLSHHPS